MNKYLLSLLCYLAVDGLFAQTGPAGVGSSASNKLWLAADKGVALTGINVSSWADQSGCGNNALPATAVNQPAFVATSVNGYPSLDFDGVNDELRVADNAGLDLTQWHIFMVVIVDAHKNYNAWMVKGNDGQENFEILSYNDGNVHAPIYYTDATRTFPSAPAGQTTTTEFNIIEYSYSSSVGRDVYKNNGTAVITDNENKTPAVNAFDIYIGNEKTTSRYLDGDIAEVIIYNAPLNSAQRIIVNNYLAAKYNRTLTNNDLYDEDNVGFDHDVAGIGRVNATNLQNDSKGLGIVRMLNPTGLGNDEFLIWGHDNGFIQATNTTDIPAGIQARSNRIWRISERNAANSASVDVGNVDIQFDLSGLGAIIPSDLRLLIDTDNDGLFSDETPISGATLVSGSTYQFAGVSGTTLTDNRRFTFATINSIQTPLPVELLSFAAKRVGQNVKVNWETATEVNNDFFSLERSADGILFSELSVIDGAGNSSSNLSYQFMDHNPLDGISYYRLKQVDFDGSFRYSNIATVDLLPSSSDFDFIVFPNPSSGNELNFNVNGQKGDCIEIKMYDISGRICFEFKQVLLSDGDSIISVIPEFEINAGLYTATVSNSRQIITKKLLVLSE